MSSASSAWRPSVPEITARTFPVVVKEHAILAVHFWKPKSAADIEFHSNIVNLSRSLAGQVHFVCCNVDLGENVPLCKSVGANQTPTLTVFLHGQPKWSLNGPCSSSKLLDKFQPILTKAENFGLWDRILRWFRGGG